MPATKKPKLKRSEMPLTKLAKKRKDREKAILAESQYKTIHRNPEVFEAGTALVSDVIENDDGSATIQVEFNREQRDMIFDVALRQAIVNGLQKMDVESEAYSEMLSIKNQVIEQARVVAEVLTAWETMEDFDYSPICATEVALLRNLLAKL